MNIIPVIDYQNGHVVLAKMGERSKYRPVESKLCTSSNIYDVIESILTLANFKTIYIADLDCIEKQQLDTSLWTNLCQHFHHIEFWIDLGNACDMWPKFMQHVNNARPVIGTESFSSNEQLNLSIDALIHYQPILSIDYIDDSILGISEINPAKYIDECDIIVLSISHVGSDCGPNYKIIEKFLTINQTTHIYYGGGIRHFEDIKQIDALNIDGVLVASSLHNGNISQQQLKSLTF